MQGHFADTMEVASSWANIERLHIAVRDAIGRHAFVMAHLSHAYREGCSIYFSFVGRGTTDVYDAAWRDALDAVRVAGGTVTHHHGAGQLKSLAAAREIGAAFRLWAAAKARLDPAAIMNPGMPYGDREQRGEEPPVLGEEPCSRSIGRACSRRWIRRARRSTRRSPPRATDSATGGMDCSCRGFRHSGAATTTCARRRSTACGRFPDGLRVRLGHAPRSAAGPDLRWELLRTAAIEMVEVAIEPVA